MATTQKASAIICDAGPNTITGPVDIIRVICSGAVTIAKGATTIVTLASGNHDVELRSASDLIVTGACTLLLRTSKH